jgi:hypothetical protein
MSRSPIPRDFSSVSILGCAATNWLAGLADAVGATPIVHDLVVDSGAGFVAFAGVALHETFIGTWRT